MKSFQQLEVLIQGRVAARLRKGGVIPSSLAVGSSMMLLAMVCPSQPLRAQGVALRLSHEWTIGRLGKSEGETFGDISDVVVSSKYVYVLDSRLYRVSRFDASTGNYLGSIGGGGRGPAEFFVPRALAQGGQLLYVLDPGDRRVSVFSTSHAEMTLVRIFRLDFDGWDLCAVDGRVFVVGARRGKTIHEFSSSGEYVKSFGALDASPNPILRNALSQGSLECVPEIAGLIYLPRLRPEIYTYTWSGALQWSARIPGYRQVAVRETGAGGVVFSAPGKPEVGHDVGSEVGYLGDGKVLVQVGRLTVRSVKDRSFAEIVSYIYRLDDGLRLSSFRDLPRVVGVGHGRLVALDNGVFPAVSAFTYIFR